MQKPTLVILAIGALTLAGCQSNGAGASPGVAASTRPARTVRVPADSTLLREGIPPMSYMLGSGGTIRIVDATDEKIEPVTARVPVQSVILVDATRGVVVGIQTIIKGPLEKDHRYQIWLDRR